MIRACALNATALPEMDYAWAWFAGRPKMPDAFVEFGVGTTQTPCTTTVWDNDASPVWDRCCEFSCGTSPCEVWFKVYDAEWWSGSELMGFVTVSAEGDSSHALGKGGTLHVSILSLTGPAGPASPPHLPLTPSTPPDMEQLCADECRALGFCCGDHTIGSNQFMSCSQACMIRTRGSSAEACAASCDEPRACERAVNGVTYGMCGTCSDLDLECPLGVQSTAACHAGCEMGEIGEASGLECPAEWTDVGNRCVRRFGVQEAERLSWEGAEAACVVLGGHLASTDSLRGLEQLADFCFQGGLDADCALGLRRSSPRTGTWIWTDGTPWSGGLATMLGHISNWGDHVHLDRQYGGWGMLQGDSDGGSGPFAYVCQQPWSSLPPGAPLPPASPCPEVMCALWCEHGYATDGDGCQLCVCIDAPSASPPPSPSPPPLPNNVRIEFFGTGVDCGSLPSLDGLSPVQTAYVPRFGLGRGHENTPNLHGFGPGNDFAVVQRGFVPVRLEGSYTFLLTVGRKDTASLTIDGAEILATGCSPQGTQEYTASVHLGSGAHLLHIVFADDGWSDHLARPPPRLPCVPMWPMPKPMPMPMPMPM